MSLLFSVMLQNKTQPNESKYQKLEPLQLVAGLSLAAFGCNSFDHNLLPLVPWPTQASCHPALLYVGGILDLSLFLPISISKVAVAVASCMANSHSRILSL